MTFFDQLKERNDILYYFGMVCFVLAVVCAVLIRFTNVQVMGVNAWYKPLKFFLSTAIFVWSMGWYTHYLQLPSLVWWYSLGLVVFFTIEDVYILAQAMRGETSHFNVSTPFHRFMWFVMAACAIAISVTTLALSVKFFTSPLPGLPVHYAWAVRIALVTFVIFSLEGMAMGARMAHSVGAADGSEGISMVNWSKTAGDLRVAHFVGMHALQVIPLMSFFVFRSTAGTIGFAVVYFAFSVFTLVQALNGKSIVEALRIW